MIKSYDNKLAEQVVAGKFSKKLPSTIRDRALMWLVQLDNATSITST